METLIPVEIIALLEEPGLQAPVIVLHSREPNKVLPIWIGHTEAKAIAVILENIETQRPLTHDLLLNTIKSMDGKMSKVVISRLDGTTYCATISVSRGPERIEIDARPSDAIALALKARTPIFIRKELMEKAGQENPFEQPSQSQKAKTLTPDELKKMRAFLKQAQKREQGAE